MDPNTPPKPTRQGITEADVWRAADAVLAEGRRPTIEAVRTRLGRGSPNTVMAHLDSWFGRLGARLAPLAPAGEGDTALPMPVAEAMHHFWHLAVGHARETVDREMATLRDRLTTEAEALARDTQRARALEDELQAADKARTEALEIAREQLTEAVRKTHRLEARINDLTAEHRGLEEDLREARIAVDAERSAAQDQARRAADERALEAERAKAAEHRWMAELDAARQEARKARAELERALKSLAAERADLARLREEAAAREKALAGQLDGLRHETQDLKRTQAALEEARERALGERDEMIQGLQWRLDEALQNVGRTSGLKLSVTKMRPHA